MRGAPRGRGRIFDNDTVEDIRGWHKRGMYYKELAEMYYCSISTIRDVIKEYGAYRRDSNE